LYNELFRYQRHEKTAEGKKKPTKNPNSKVAKQKQKGSVNEEQTMFIPFHQSFK